jgi:uncharacterized damage-inducible protein DinB
MPAILWGGNMDIDATAMVRDVLIKELERLRDQVRELCQPLSEEGFWQKPIQPGNSVGHLVLHLTGNLNHFVGGQLGGTDYVRDREREFTEIQHPTKSAALEKLDAAVAVFRQAVGNLDAQRLAEPHPEKRFGTVLNGLMQLISHFALHRGQMSYIVRLLEPSRGK